MSSIVLATGNPHKVEELRSLFTPLGIQVVGLADVPTAEPIQEPAETGSTFAQNAAIKAVSYARQTGRLCLADDSGLEIDALEGRPGVISSHYCTDGREEGMSRAERDRLNNQRILRELNGVPLEDRTARFVCCMCLADPHGRIVTRCRGTFEGLIGIPPTVPRGDNGFGYDPLFLVTAEPHHGRVTSAELPPAEKNRLSHRGEAARIMADQLQTLGLVH